MTIWSIVPVKPLRLGKSRLSNVLNDEERARLNRMLLERTLDVLREMGDAIRTLVVSRDPAVLAIAREYNTRTVLEDGTQHLNTALIRATAIASYYDAHGVLILPADLPLITAADLREFLKHGDEPPVVAIAPDRREDGTNAMLICPPNLIRYEYGPGSFARHCNQVKRTSATLEIVRIQTLLLDLDLPEDLDFFKQWTGIKTSALHAQLNE
jgi:2-phospho-L-lactate guanylyltransferase